MSDIVVHDIQTPDDDADALLVLVGHNGPTPPFSGHKEMAAERQNCYDGQTNEFACHI